MENQELVRWNLGADITEADRERVRECLKTRGLKIGWVIVRLLIMWAGNPHRLNLEEGKIKNG